MQVTATMAGTVLSVLVEKDEMVKEGQEVVMIESMKMEIPIESAGEGKVKEIHVQAGDFVNEGDVLITLE
ncbi:acetyl-CoA carboxylase biotin carboxyl carrier protein [Bacillus oleivorans]|uniref:Acetyl-CoA carboxylase biotin carboxyl carrier protein n=1 Tax=Bacillus oleivorans TaxID=1448271 RepID=A0A285D0R4_9BACI|nr:biotin/lipoyl-containing protein [Bacillus oleivorans]SNX73404.1 acetyl-CoA carboxylase biotin carboxyl carrier protein [Bacillus oleivorans]